jgi:hypothetical protein
MCNLYVNYPRCITRCLPENVFCFRNDNKWKFHPSIHRNDMELWHMMTPGDFIGFRIRNKIQYTYRDVQYPFGVVNCCFSVCGYKTVLMLYSNTPYIWRNMYTFKHTWNSIRCHFVRLNSWSSKHKYNTFIIVNNHFSQGSNNYKYIKAYISL